MDFLFKVKRKLMQKQKICSSCNKIKDISEFYTNPSNVDGYSNICKECQKAYSAKWSNENRERKNQTARERYARRKQEFLEKLAEEENKNEFNQNNN